MGHVCLTWPDAGALGGTPPVCRKRKIRQSHLSPQALWTPGARVGGSCWHQSLNLPPPTHTLPAELSAHVLSNPNCSWPASCQTCPGPLSLSLSPSLGSPFCPRLLPSFAPSSALLVTGRPGLHPVPRACLSLPGHWLSRAQAHWISTCPGSLVLIL